MTADSRDASKHIWLHSVHICPLQKPLAHSCLQCPLSSKALGRAYALGEKADLSLIQGAHIYQLESFA